MKTLKRPTALIAHVRKTIFATFLIAVVAIPLSLEAASKVRLYDLSTGEVAVLEYKNKWWMGHGPITGALAGGEKLQGEFTTVPASDSAWGTIYGQGVARTHKSKVRGRNRQAPRQVQSPSGCVGVSATPASTRTNASYSAESL